MTSLPKGAKKVLLVEITRVYVQSTVATRVGGRSGEKLSTSGIAARWESGLVMPEQQEGL